MIWRSLLIVATSWVIHQSPTVLHLTSHWSFHTNTHTHKPAHTHTHTHTHTHKRTPTHAHTHTRTHTHTHTHTHAGIVCVCVCVYVCEKQFCSTPYLTHMYRSWGAHMYRSWVVSTHAHIPMQKQTFVRCVCIWHTVMLRGSNGLVWGGLG